MDRAQKKAYVEDLNTALQNSETVVVAHYKGLTVAQMNNLRSKVRGAGASFKVTKNTLTRRALEGTRFEGIADLLTGPTAVCYSSDPVAPAKMMVEFSKDNDHLILLGGAFGEQVMDAKQIETLSKMPSLDELRATIIAMLQTPATRIAGVLQAPAGQLARVLGAYAAK